MPSFKPTLWRISVFAKASNQQTSIRASVREFAVVQLIKNALIFYCGRHNGFELNPFPCPHASPPGCTLPHRCVDCIVDVTNGWSNCFVYEERRVGYKWPTGKRTQFDRFATKYFTVVMMFTFTCTAVHTLTSASAILLLIYLFRPCTKTKVKSGDFYDSKNPSVICAVRLLQYIQAKQ